MLFLNYVWNAVLSKSDYPIMCLLLSTNHTGHENFLSYNISVSSWNDFLTKLEETEININASLCFQMRKKKQSVSCFSDQNCSSNYISSDTE